MAVNGLSPNKLTQPVPAGEPYRPKYIVTAEGRISYPLNENGEPDLEKMREIKHALRHFTLGPYPNRSNWGESYYKILGPMSSFQNAATIGADLKKRIDSIWPAHDLNLNLTEEPHPDNIVK